LPLTRLADFRRCYYAAGFAAGHCRQPRRFMFSGRFHAPIRRRHDITLFAASQLFASDDRDTPPASFTPESATDLV
jgi:hypothetical protein